MLNLEFFNRPTSISAKVIADSISEAGVRITTFEIEYPRIVMSEFNTMRAISKNSSSSRAIPVSKMLEHTVKTNLKPIYFGAKQSGMQAGDELVGEDLQYAQDVWESALTRAVGQAELLDECGVAKEVTNRLVEPFQLVKVVCTATDWDNFFNLRLHPDSDPNICMLAYKMYKAMQQSSPNTLREGEWHLPYVETSRGISGEENEPCILYWHTNKMEFLTLEQAQRISAASCASVSYRTEGMTLEKADKIFDMLINAEVVHSSPFEHLATPIVEYWSKQGDTFDVFINKELSRNVPRFQKTWQEGITHSRKDGKLCSGNLTGWVQYRHLLPNNTAWKFDFDKRMELFN